MEYCRTCGQPAEKLSRAGRCRPCYLQRRRVGQVQMSDPESPVRRRLREKQEEQLKQAYDLVKGAEQ